jgi:hypothetical protein
MGHSHHFVARTVGPTKPSSPWHEARGVKTAGEGEIPDPGDAATEMGSPAHAELQVSCPSRGCIHADARIRS